jgi:glucokinase
MAILAADIGKTTSTLALFAHSTDKESKVTKLDSMLSSRQFDMKDHLESVQDLVSIFLEKNYHTEEPIYGACFGVGAPVKQKREASLKLQDKIITLSSSEFQKRLPCPDVPVRFINDMEAIGYSIFLGDGEERLETIHDGKQGIDKRENRALMLVSDGLGQALWHCCDWKEGTLKPIPSEGGHADFASRFPHESSLFIDRLREKLNKNVVSYESVLSSSGLSKIYNLLSDNDSNLDAHTIINEARKNNDLCKRALKIFISLWGAEAGNMALRYLASGGVYIGGLPIDIETFKDGTFLEAFIDKEDKNLDVFSKLNENIPIKLFKYEGSILLGAARYAVHDGLVSQGKFAIMRANQ